MTLEELISDYMYYEGLEYYEAYEKAYNVIREYDND